MKFIISKAISNNLKILLISGSGLILMSNAALGYYKNNLETTGSKINQINSKLEANSSTVNNSKPQALAKYSLNDKKSVSSKDLIKNNQRSSFHTGEMYIKMKKNLLKKLTLQDALQIAYEYNPRFKYNKSYLGRQEVEANKNARSIFLPKIYLSSEISQSNRDIIEYTNYDKSKNQTSSSNSSNLTISQNLFSFGQGSFAAKSARKNVDSSVAGFFEEESRCFLELIKFYIEVLSRKEYWDISKDMLKDAKTIFDSESEKKFSGFATEVTYQIAKANYELRVAETAELENGYQVSLNDLKAYLVSSQDLDLVDLSKIELVWPTIPLDLNLDHQAIESRIKTQNHNIIKTEKRAEAARYATKSSAAGLLPNVSAKVSIFNTNSNYDRDRIEKFVLKPNIIEASNTFGAQGSISIEIPIFDITKIDEVRAAGYEEASSRYAAADAKRIAMTEFHKTITGLQSMTVLIKARELAYRSAKLAAGAAKEEYRSGQKSLIDYLNLRVSEFEANKNLIRQKQNMVLSWYNFMGIMGELDAKSLNIKGNVFVPKISKSN